MIVVESYDMAVVMVMVRRCGFGFGFVMLGFLNVREFGGMRRCFTVVVAAEKPSRRETIPLALCGSSLTDHGESQNMKTSESGLVRRLLRSHGRIGVAVLVVLERQVRFSFVLGFKKSDYLEYKESNNHAAVVQRKLEVKQLEGKTNTDSLVNKQVHHGENVRAVIMKTGVLSEEGAEGYDAERYRGDSNMAALGVAAVIKEYAHESLTFRDAVACEVISKWIYVMKEDMDTRPSMCMLSNDFRRSSDDSNILYWNCAPVRKRKQFSNEMSVHILLGGHSTLSLEGGLSGNRDEEKKSKGSCIYALGSHVYQIVCTRPDIASADVGMLNVFDCGL
ncbi:hypothetical protein Tco_0829273 [Tanacetum coccineum]